MALERAEACGKLLADILMRKEQGMRPVTLIGYSMGARLIYFCLKCLSESGDGGCGIVENAVLLGSPVSLKNEEWTCLGRVVSGRLINGFSSNDWILAVMYRYQGWAINVCGTTAIDNTAVENVDLSNVINGHMEYRCKMGPILRMLRIK